MQVRASKQADIVLQLMKVGVDYSGRELCQLVEAKGYQWAVPGTMSRILRELRDRPDPQVVRRELARKCRHTGILVDVHVKLPQQVPLW
jgi:hypothetical protein